MSNAVELVLFVALSATLLGSALGMILTRNVVHAAFLLLAVSLSSAGIFALLRANYVALMQLLVYAGAVAILNIFTIMITMRRREDAIRGRDFSLPAMMLGMSFFGLVAIAIFSGSLPQVVGTVATPGLERFGEILFSATGWSLPFEIASLVLTAALIGAVWWSKEGDE
jgi:NADH-quinone oxidoreductase subunit J